MAIKRPAVHASPRSADPAWDGHECKALIRELWTLREAMLDHERRLHPWIEDVDAAHRASAANLAHYLALRRHDLRRLQQRLSDLGLSSLGRSESHVLANLDKVLGILHRLDGQPWTSLSAEEPTGPHRGPALLAAHGEALFGAVPEDRAVRIMVTLPGEAAHDDVLVDALVRAGMDVARINCAHDDAAAWASMAERVRRSAREAGRSVRVLMDLGGPKLRTGEIEGGEPVLKLKPAKDAFGRVVAPARLGLHADDCEPPVDIGLHWLGVDAAWLATLQVGCRIRFEDARAAARRLTVVERYDDRAIVELSRTAYLCTRTRLTRRNDDGTQEETALRGLPVPPGEVLLHLGDIVDVVAQGSGRTARKARRAVIPCTLPEALASVRNGDRIWFDDGRIGGIVRKQGRRRVEVEIIQAREGGERLAADKGINLPDTELKLPALTAQDLLDLDTVVQHADLVGLSFAQSADDVRRLRAELAQRACGELGIVLKIETRRGFENLPQMLLAAMAGPRAGVMIARGDLAVECGFERMAEVQEEILWACEAAHMPVVWATQVLETLAKTGLPSRAEITDAAAGVRAECVMLNKGPHIVDAMRTLDDILRRMQQHQQKKRPQLRALKSWADAAPPRAAGRRAPDRKAAEASVPPTNEVRAR
jgi:pyruvate kinase